MTLWREKEARRGVASLSACQGLWRALSVQQADWPICFPRRFSANAIGRYWLFRSSSPRTWKAGLLAN